MRLDRTPLACRLFAAATVLAAVFAPGAAWGQTPAGSDGQLRLTGRPVDARSSAARPAPTAGPLRGAARLISSERRYVPRHERTIGSRLIQAQEPEELDGPMLYDHDYSGAPEPFFDDMTYGAMPIGDPCCGAPAVDCCLIPCPVLPWDRIELFAGSHGFTGPANRGSTGSFGFYEGGNVGVPMPCFGGAIGAQAGARIAHSNFSGAEFTREDRTQVFLTGGLFRRVDWGLQGGVVFDYLHDNWYFNLDATQLRGEVSWMYPQHHELGFWFTQRLRSVEATSRLRVNGQRFELEEQFAPNELYAFFYRYRMDNCGGGEGRFFAGFTGKGDGLVGSEMTLPVTDRFAVETAVAYLVPEQRSATDHRREAWNVSVGVVWYLGGRDRSMPDYFRPLMRVAGNNNFILHRDPQ